MSSSKLGNPNLARIVFARRNVQPPTDLYVSSDDHLTVSAIRSGTDQDPPFILVRLLRPTGEVQHMQYRIAQASFVISAIERFPLAEGLLLGVEVRAGAGDVQRGDLWVSIELTRMLGPVNQEHAVLAQGYVGHFSPVGWPAGGLGSPQEGPGRDLLFIQPAPLPGQTILLTVPSQHRWRIKGMNVGLTTSAAAGNRQVMMLVVGLSTATVVHWVSPVAQPPATTYSYHGAEWGHVIGLVAAVNVEAGLPLNVWLRGNHQVIMTAIGLQGGDQFGPSHWYIEQALIG